MTGGAAAERFRRAVEPAVRGTAGVKAEVPNRPGGHLLIISVSASWRARRPA